jgi:hypothetical protein
MKNKSTIRYAMVQFNTLTIKRIIKTIQVLYFNYKTYMNEVYKIKETNSGAAKLLLTKDDSFNPPQDNEVTINYSKLQIYRVSIRRSYHTRY